MKNHWLIYLMAVSIIACERKQDYTAAKDFIHASIDLTERVGKEGKIFRYLELRPTDLEGSPLETNDLMLGYLKYNFYGLKAPDSIMHNAHKSFEVAENELKTVMSENRDVLLLTHELLHPEQSFALRKLTIDSLMALSAQLFTMEKHSQGGVALALCTGENPLLNTYSSDKLYFTSLIYAFCFQTIMRDMTDGNRQIWNEFENHFSEVVNRTNESGEMVELEKVKKQVWYNMQMSEALKELLLKTYKSSEIKYFELLP